MSSAGRPEGGYKTREEVEAEIAALSVPLGLRAERLATAVGWASMASAIQGSRWSRFAKRGAPLVPAADGQHFDRDRPIQSSVTACSFF